MTSFASAFGSSDQKDNYSNNIEINLTNNNNDDQELNHFSNIDLGQQSLSSKEYCTPFLNLSDAAATFQTDSSSTAGAIPNSPSHSPSFSSQERSFSKIKCF